MTAQAIQVLDGRWVRDMTDELDAEILALVRSMATPGELAAGTVSRTGEAAADYMDAFISAWTLQLTAEPQWSSAKALYVSRRFPWDLFARLFFGSDSLEPHRKSLLAGTERLLTIHFGSAGPRSQDDTWVQETAVFPVTDHDMRAFWRRVFRTAHLWLLHNTARVVGKGCNLAFAVDQFPAAEVSESLQYALDLYDRRMPSASAVGIAGTRVWLDGAPQDPLSIALCFPRDDGPQDIAVHEAVASRVRADSARRGERKSADSIEAWVQAAPYEVTYVNLGPMADLSRSLEAGVDSWSSDELAAVLALCVTVRVFRDDPVLKHQLPHYGYLRVVPGHLVSMFKQAAPEVEHTLDQVLPGTSFAPRETLAVLRRATGQVRPVVDGPILRETPDGMIMVDLVTASRRVAWLLAVTKVGGGSVGAARGIHFEAFVQDEIDRLEFGPASDLRALVGKTLKRSGDVLTDIDAIAALPDGPTLLVQAKSYPYDADYAAGAFQAVRNRRTTVENDVVKWEAKVKKVLAVRSGPDQNYELPKAMPFGWVMVTPFPIFLQQPLCDEETLPGLRRVSSIDEFTTWLAERTSSQ